MPIKTFGPIVVKISGVNSPEIPAYVSRLLADSISSVSQLEVLLLLMRGDNREWTATDASRELYIQEDPAAAHLAKLHAAKLVTRSDDTPYRYRYGPASSTDDRAARELASLYSIMRLRIINEIMHNPLDGIQSFADAFKIRKDNE